MFEATIDKASTKSKIYAMRKMGVPYAKNYEDIANQDLEKQATEIAAKLYTDNQIKIASDKEIIALIAYLQRLGRDIKLEPKK
jgi:cytochrome c oxidase cbb3-type subunit I/II